MANDSSDEVKQGGKTKRRRGGRPPKEKDVEQTLINVERAGEWMPVEDLLQAARTAAAAGQDVNLNLDKIDHLDASALQVLLALEAEYKKRGRIVELAHVSPSLRQWFEYAGATEKFFLTPANHA